MSNISMTPIGSVQNAVRIKKDTAWGKDISTIVLKEEFRGGLQGLEGFSHAVILTWLDKAAYISEKHLRRRPQGREDMPVVGIFSQRTKDHPNTIGVTSVQILAVEENALTVQGLDAMDGTPVLDIKPYYPVFDKRDAQVPEWVDRLMTHYF